MQHRHINTQHWSKEAIDSALERGGLRDWQELFREVRKDKNLATKVIEVASDNEATGSSLAISLAQKMWDI